MRVDREQELWEKVVEGLECCAIDGGCGACPYDSLKDCPGSHPTPETLMKDALALLKRQAAVKPVWHSCDERIGFFACGACGANMGTSPKYCWYCGRKVKWDG